MILLYRGNKDAYFEVAKQILKDRTIRFINDSMLDCTMEQLIDPNSQLEFSSEPTQEYDAVFVYFTEDEREQIIPMFNHFDQQGLDSPVAAVQTPNNLKMTLKEELDDVMAEDRYFKKRNRLIDFLENLEPARLEQDQEYSEFAMLVFNMMQKDALPEEVLDEVIKILESMENEQD